MKNGLTETLSAGLSETPKRQPRGLTRGEFLKMLGLGALALEFAPILAACVRDDKPESKKADEAETSGATKTPLEVLAELAQEEKINPYFDMNGDFFQAAPDGNIPDRKNRFKRLDENVLLLQDIGLDFYYVLKGDTISGIREKLGKYAEYTHVKDQTGKLESFNIPPKELVAGMWLPIPMKNSDRTLTDEQFAVYAYKGIQEMKKDPVYGEDMTALLENISEEDLIASMVGLAKKESGGKPLGQFSFQRWEPRHNRFSFSIFHVLMKGSGIIARQKLNITEGQTFHPINAVKLMLAFIFEKSDHKPADVLPFEQDWDKFATFYNGAHWKRINPDYVKLLKKYYGQSQQLIADFAPGTKLVPEVDIAIASTKPEIQPVPIIEEPASQEEIQAEKKAEKEAAALRGPRDETFVRVANASLKKVIQNSNYINSKRRLDENGMTILQTNTNLAKAADSVTAYLKRRHGHDTYYPDDMIAVGEDERGRYVLFLHGQTGAAKRAKNTAGKYEHVRVDIDPVVKRSLLAQKKSEPVAQKEKSEPDAQFQRVGKRVLKLAVKDANFVNSAELRTKSSQTILQSDTNIDRAVVNLVSYLKRRYGSEKYFADDRVAVGTDLEGPYIIFKAGGQGKSLRGAASEGRAEYVRVDNMVVGKR